MIPETSGVEREREGEGREGGWEDGEWGLNSD